jgi:hypothetical protein
MVIIYSMHWSFNAEWWGPDRYRRLTSTDVYPVGISDCLWVVPGTWEDT